MFTNTDIIAELIYEHLTIEPMVVQKHDEKTTLLAFAEGKEIKKYVIRIECDIATPKQVSIGN